MTPPLVLGFDTSEAHCAAAVIRGDDVLATSIEAMSKGQAERVMPLIEELLMSAGATWSDLDAIGVGIGPGNFTGIRISVSAARGLALSLGIPAVGVSRFDALALGYDAAVLCSVKAPRDQLYTQILNAGAPNDPILSTLDTVPLPHARAEAAVIGEKSTELAQRTGGSAIDPAYPLPVAIARIAAMRKDNVDLKRPTPMYIRPADAAPSRDKPPVILDDA